MTLYELIEQLSKYKCVKTIKYNPYNAYAVIYLHRTNRNDIDVIIKALTKAHKNVIVSILRDKNMIVLRERYEGNQNFGSRL